MLIYRFLFVKKSIFVGPLVSCTRRFAFTLGFLVIKLTRTDNVILLQMPVSNSISDTGESWSTDSPAKQKTMRNAIQILLLKRTPKISFQPMKNRTPSYITLNCNIFSLPFIRSLRSLSETSYKYNSTLRKNFPCFSCWWDV